MALQGDVTNPAESNDQTTRQLDFYQAMVDFKLMFPSLDEDVIEAVLRANNGAVDGTIDQLLNMSTDVDDVTEDSCKLLKRSKDSYININSSSQPISSDGNDDPKAFQNSSFSLSVRHNKAVNEGYTNIDEVDSHVESPPPSYSDYANLPSQNDTVSDVISHSSGSAPIDMKCSSRSEFSSPSRSPNFLKHSPNRKHASLDTTMKQKYDLLEEDSITITPMPPKMNLLDHRYTVSSLSESSFPSWNPPLLGKLPDDFLRISSPQSANEHSPKTSSSKFKTRSIRSDSSSPSWSPKLPRFMSYSMKHHQPASALGSERLNSNMNTIQKRMAENDHKRAQAASANVDPSAMQMLEDERVALAIQNEEFLSLLRQDKEFMQMLEKDRMNAAAFEPESPCLDPDRPPSDKLEGYGQNAQEELGAFPFSQAFGKEDHAEFRRQLKHMGGTTKKKMQALAKKYFTRKKKKSPKLSYKNTGAPSTTNLLDEDDEYFLQQPRDLYDDNMESPNKLQMPQYRVSNTLDHLQSLSLV